MHAVMHSVRVGERERGRSRPLLTYFSFMVQRSLRQFSQDKWCRMSFGGERGERGRERGARERGEHGRRSKVRKRWGGRREKLVRTSSILNIILDSQLRLRSHSQLCFEASRRFNSEESECIERRTKHQTLNII